MNADHRTGRFTLGAAALIALCGGCAHESPPPRTSPTFESRVTPLPADTTTTTIIHQDGTSSSVPAPPQVAAPDAPPPSATDAPSPPKEANERQLCDELGRDAKVTVADVQGGIVVTAEPKGGASLASVQRDAKRIGEGMAEVAPVAGAKAATGESKVRCSLFDVGRQGGRLTIVEAEKTVTLTFTTADASSVKALRAQVRQFVKTLAGNAVTTNVAAPSRSSREFTLEAKPGKHDAGDSGAASSHEKADRNTAPQKSGPGTP